MIRRQIIRIDAEKCNGCGRCVSSCPEGALQLVNGKAQLLRNNYCDGLGACIGECPAGAISLVEQEAAEFGSSIGYSHPKANRVLELPDPPLSPDCEKQLSDTSIDQRATAEFPGSLQPNEIPEAVAASHAGARASKARDERPALTLLQWASADGDTSDTQYESPALADGSEPSALTQWPVQLSLVPPTAPFLRGADLLLAADCVPVAMGDFHRRLLAGRSIVLGCPKLEDRQRHAEKLAAIIAQATPQRITVVHMEVPCCSGLVQLVQHAMQLAGRSVRVEQIKVARDGRVIQAGVWDI